MKKKIKADGRTKQCKICYEMARRGYRSENKYWEDFFKHKEKKIKYILI